jgi:outer membrane protein OmpA-like peptidoglycan-associated protein
MIRNHLLFIGTGLGVSILAGCAAAPEPDPALLRAQTEVGAAANNPDIVAFAAPQLNEAQQALHQSQSALKDRDMPSVDHYAFLASRHAETAEQIARQKKAEQVVENAPAARNQVLLQGARNETARANNETARAKAETEEAREEARKQAQSAKGIVLTPRNIVFKVGSAHLDQKATNELQQIANYLRANPDRKVVIEGYTDSTGSAAVNQQLSEQRADAVRLALSGDGVDATRIQIRGMGPAQPIADNADNSGRLINRRVAIIISNADGSFPQVSP